MKVSHREPGQGGSSQGFVDNPNMLLLRSDCTQNVADFWKTTSSFLLHTRHKLSGGFSTSRSQSVTVIQEQNSFSTYRC